MHQRYLLNQYQKIFLFLNKGFVFNGETMLFQRALIKNNKFDMFCLKNVKNKLSN